MRKSAILLLVLLSVASGLLFSCGNGLNKNAGNLTFDSLQLNVTEHLFGDTANPACNLIINFAYAKSADDARLKDTLNAFLQSVALGDQYLAMSPAEAVESYAKNYTSGYRKDIEPYLAREKAEIAAAGEGEIAAWYSYYKKVESRVQYYAGHLLVYSVRYDEYTGGAHGIYNTSYLNLDLGTLCPLRLDDLFEGDYKEALTDLLWNQLMADNQVTTRSELEELGFASTGELEPTDNFYLCPEGITFHYNVYDIAPYVMGAVEITLSYEIMSHLLKSDVRVLDEIRNF